MMRAIAIRAAFVFAASAGPAAAVPPSWEAVWIWGGEESQPRNEYRLFRGRFELERVPPGATLYLAGGCSLRAWLNGEPVLERDERGIRGVAPYSTVEVSGRLLQGDNVLAVLVHRVTEGTWSSAWSPPGLLAQLEWREGRHRRSFISGGKWKTQEADEWSSAVPRLNEARGFCEWYDARRGQPGWQSTSWDDSGWDDAWRMVDGAEGGDVMLVPSDAPPMASTTVAPAGFTDSGNLKAGVRGVVLVPTRGLFTARSSGDLVIKPGSAATLPRITVDFGRELVACPRIDIECAPGSSIEVSYREDGEPPPREYSISADPRSDRFTTRDGPQQLQTWDTRAFRYLDIVFRGPWWPTRCRVTAVETRADLPAVPAFTSSDRTLEGIWRTSARTLDLCSLDTLVDSPRDQALSVADFKVAALAHYVTRRDQGLPARGLRIMAMGMEEDGSLNAIVPADVEMLYEENSLVWIQALRDWLVWTGNTKLVSELYPRVRLALSRLSQKRAGEGLLGEGPFRIWIDGEGAGLAQLNRACPGSPATLNAMYAGALAAASFLAEAVGERGDAESWKAMADQTGKAMNEHWNEAVSAYDDCLYLDTHSGTRSEQANVLMALFGFMGRGRAGKVLDGIYRTRNQPRTGWARIGTPYFLHYQLAAMAENGKGRDALTLLKEVWGRMGRGGASCCPSGWRGAGGAPRCRGWSVAPVHFIATCVLGVRPVPGDAGRVDVSPMVRELREASGAVATPRGMVHVAWKRIPGEKTSLDLKVPDGIEASCRIPAAGIGASSVRLNGKRIWKKGWGGNAVEERDGMLSLPLPGGAGSAIEALESGE